MYYSQAGQDKWVHKLIGDKGVYVDIGAYDGMQTSNTYALEQLGWKGICIEPNWEAFTELCFVRNSINVNRVVTNISGFCTFTGDRVGDGPPLKCDTLNNILSNSFCPKNIDYVSLDIEGHELVVLECFDFDKYDVKLMTVEHNLYCDGPEKKDALYKLLSSKGYIRAVEDVKCLDPNPLYFNQPFEDWYAKDSFYKSQR